MKIVLLDTGRGVNPDTIRMWRENLQLSQDDVVSLMAWQPPREPLPVAEHYVFGPRLPLRTREPRHVQTIGDLFGGQEIDAQTLAELADIARLDDETARQAAAAGISLDERNDAEIGDDDSPMSASDLAEQLPEAVTGPTNAAHQRVAHLPPTDPARIKHALRWRRKRVQLAARRTVAKTKTSLRTSRNPLARAARQVVYTRNGNVALLFAIALSRSRQAAELFRSADLVFPVDARSQRGAWLLARANPGPDVVVGYPAAIRALERRAS